MKVPEDTSSTTTLESARPWGDVASGERCYPPTLRPHPAPERSPRHFCTADFLNRKRRGRTSRSRSSPVRSGAERSDATRLRSSNYEVSAWVPRPPEGDARRCAYFSPTPPPGPICLLPLPTHASSRGEPPRPTAVGSPHASYRSAHTYRTMWNLLCEMVATLPLSTEAPRAPANDAVSTSECPVSSEPLPKRPRTGSRQHAERRTVAVQARGSEGVQNDSIKRNVADVVAGGECEWVGGVRAMRDSHVRLVRRQLRHIARLNRALDRVAAPHAAS